MLRTRTWLTALVAATGILTASPAAQAGLIPNKVTILPDGTDFRWTYNVVVTSDVYLTTGDYFTVYDFAGAYAGKEQFPTDWAMSTVNLGKTPGQTNPTDDPNVPNYTFTYTGPTRVVGASGLGNFMLMTPYSDSVLADFTSATHRQDNDNTEHNITATLVPVAIAPPPPIDSPEPATLALCGAALPWAVLKLRRRRA